MTCTFPPSVVDRYNVTVSFAEHTTTQSVFVDRLCGAGYYGSVGNACATCPQVRSVMGTEDVNCSPFTIPGNSDSHSVAMKTDFAFQNAICLEFVLVPIRQAGYYEESPNVFVSCVPDSACPAIDTSVLEAAVANGKLGLAPYFAALYSEVRRSVYCSVVFAAFVIAALRCLISS